MAMPLVTFEVFAGAEYQRPYSSTSERDTLTAGDFWSMWQEEHMTYSGFPVVVNPLNLALTPLYLTEEDAAELDDLLEHPRAFPTVPVRGVPRGPRSRLPRHTQ